MKTTRQINNEIEALKKESSNVAMLENAIGVKLVEKLNGVPHIESGHRMGNFCEWYIGDQLIWKSSNCEEYAKSCKYKATHGKLIIRFRTKKECKDFFVMLAETQSKKYIGLKSKENSSQITYEELEERKREFQKKIQEIATGWKSNHDKVSCYSDYFQLTK